MVAATLAALPVVVSAQPNEQANRNAYYYTLRCAAVATGTESDPRSTRTETMAAAASFRRAHSAAHRMGSLLGLSRAHIEGDLRVTGRAEVALMVRSPAYFQRTRTECAQLGL